MGEIIRITIDGKEKGSIDIINIAYDSKTKDIIITGKIIEDEDLIKQVLEGPNPAFSIRAMAQIASPEKTVNHMCLPQINIMSDYCQPILEKIKPYVQVSTPIEVPKCPITFDFTKEFLEAGISFEELNCLFEQYRDLIQEEIPIMKDEFKKLEKASKSLDASSMYAILYDVMFKYMAKYGINSTEASAMIMSDYKKYHEEKNNKGD